MCRLPTIYGMDHMRSQMKSVEADDASMQGNSVPVARTQREPKEVIAIRFKYHAKFNIESVPQKTSTYHHTVRHA